MFSIIRVKLDQPIMMLHPIERGFDISDVCTITEMRYRIGDNGAGQRMSVGDHHLIGRQQVHRI